MRSATASTKTTSSRSNGLPGASRIINNVPSMWPSIRIGAQIKL
jgi:hypothetical protein